MTYLTYHDDIVGDIRIATLEDCIKIGNNLRKQDALEMYNYDRSTPENAVINSFYKSTIAMTVLHDGVPIAMFGIMVLQDIPTLWMLTTDELKRIGRNFVKNTSDWITKMLEIYPVLIGYVDLRNQESITWLTFVKAEWVGDIYIMGIDKRPFKKFRFSKESYARFGG